MTSNNGTLLECRDVVDINTDITGIGVTVSFIAQVCLSTLIMLPLRFVSHWRPSVAAEVQHYVEPILLASTDVLALTCIAHIITALYTFNTLSYDQILHILNVHWPASLQFLGATGILWGNRGAASLFRLFCQTVCVGILFTVAVMAFTSKNLQGQIQCVQNALNEKGEGPARFRTNVIVFPTITLAFWVWTMIIVWFSRKHGPSSKAVRALRFYADLAIISVPIALALTIMQLLKAHKQLKQLKKGPSDSEWTFGQIFAMLMIGTNLWEIYKGLQEWRSDRKAGRAKKAANAMVDPDAEGVGEVKEGSGAGYVKVGVKEDAAGPGSEIAYEKVKLKDEEA